MECNWCNGPLGFHWYRLLILAPDLGFCSRKCSETYERNRRLYYPKRLAGV